MTIECKVTQQSWWGIDIWMNEELTEDIITGVEGSGGLGEVITGAFLTAGVLTGPLAALIGGAFGAAFVLKVVEIKLVDNGYGVHWPISWGSVSNCV